MNYSGAALLLLVVGLVTHYGWGLVPADIAAEAWNIGGAFGRLVLLGMVCAIWRSELVLAVGAWWAFEEVQVIGCGVAWLVAPWPVQPGDERCSAWLGIPLGAIGVCVVMVLTVWIYTRKGAGRNGRSNTNRG